MADKTTNLQLQKIADTDYAGNFPTIYNNNLDLIDVLNNKQDKLIAGDGITIADDGKTISSSGKEWKLHTSNNFSDIITSNAVVINDSHSYYEFEILKDLRFTFYIGYCYGSSQEQPPENFLTKMTVKEFNVSKGKYKRDISTNIFYFNRDYTTNFYYSYYSNIECDITDFGITYTNDNLAYFSPQGTETLCLWVIFNGNSSQIAFSLKEPSSNIQFGRILSEPEYYSFDKIKQLSLNRSVATDVYAIYKIEYFD